MTDPIELSFNLSFYVEIAAVGQTFTVLEFPVLFDLDQIEYNDKFFLAPFRIGVPRQAGGIFRLNYLLDRGPTSSLFNLRFRTNTETSFKENRFSINSRLGLLGLIEKTFFSAFRIQIATDLKVPSFFILRYRFEKSRIGIRDFSLKFRSDRSIPRSLTFPIQYRMRFADILLYSNPVFETLEGVTDYNFEINLSPIEEKRLFVLFIDNGNRYFDYRFIFERNKNKDDRFVSIYWIENNKALVNIKNIYIESSLSISMTDDLLNPIGSRWRSVIPFLEEVEKEDILKLESEIFRFKMLLPEDCCFERGVKIDELDKLCRLSPLQKEDSIVISIDDRDLGPLYCSLDDLYDYEEELGTNG